MKEVDGVSLATNVELVEVAEKIDAALFYAESTPRRRGGGRLLVNGFKYFEDGRSALAFFVED